MPTTLRKVADIAALTALEKYSKDDLTFVIGTDDFFKFSAASSATHDGTDVVKPSNLLARKEGRWVRAKFSTADLFASANAKALLAAADYAAMRGLLDLEAGTDFYSKSAADSQFATAAGLAAELVARASGDTAAIAAAAADATSKANAAQAAAEATAAADATSKANAAQAAAIAASQPVNAELTAIAALSTTAFGRALLVLADAAALTALGNAFAGDSGMGGTKGLVPAPQAGDAAAGKFLKADGTWAVPA